MSQVLVVDDYADTRELLATILELAGYDVLLAASGAEAVTLAQTYRPGVVVMDIFMPDMDGIEATGRIRAINGLEAVRVVACSGRPRNADYSMFDAVCPKPCPPETLLEVIGRLSAET